MSSLSHKLAYLSNNPGCYLFKNKASKIIYIGKARNLKKRVKSYWQKNSEDIKTRKLVEEIADFDFIITDTEVEALLLEAKLIKENQPKYNMELKGGVRYAYIKITNEDFPRLETARTFKRSDKIYGPFALASTRKNLIRLANSLFKLRTEKRKSDQVGNKYRIRCSTAPWLRLVTKEEYQRDIAKAEMLLKGETKNLIKELEEEMNNFSQDQQFELAKLRRDQIQALENLAQEQKVQLRKAYDQDVISYVKLANKFVVQLFNINKGVVSGRKEFKFKIHRSEEFLFDFLTQYYYSNEIPQEIIIPAKIKDQKILENYLTKLSGRKTEITIPQKGDKLKLLELVKKNITASLERGDSALFELQLKLSLPRLPIVIECFDVSNLGANQMVGSMVYFENGRPDKNNYRRFKIKYQRDQSDFDAMNEIVFRRYYRLKKEDSATAKARLANRAFAGRVFPDLILVDGGKPQLTAARGALRSLGLELPLAALAKKQEELFLPGAKYPLRLPKKSDALHLIQKIRDEAHRFAIAYHRLLRNNDFRD